MKQSQYKTIALLLAILVFLSTTGVGMVAGWCHCTKQAVASIFVPLDCCKHLAVVPAEDDCCTATIASINQDEPVFSTQKCCDTSFEYNTANIDFTTSDISDLRSLVWDVCPTFSTFRFQALQNTRLPLFLLEKANPNKAPPLRPFGKELLHFIQIYRC